MTRERYRRITGRTRSICAKLPGGPLVLNLPTWLLAAAYIGALLWLLSRRDARLLRAAAVPAACFAAATVLRLIIHRQRPYDRFGLPPVGRYTPGKYRSLPSRHAASAAAIAFALIWLFPYALPRAAAGALALTIAALRVLAGHHHPSDVIAALALSGALSWAGFMML